MKRELTVLGTGFGLFVVMNFFAVLGRAWLPSSQFLWVGAAWVLGSAICFFTTKRTLTSWLLVLVNVAMAGLVIGAYFIHFRLPVYDLKQIFFWALGLLLVHGMLMKVTNWHYKTSFWLAMGCIVGVGYGIYVSMRGLFVWGSGLAFLFLFLLCMNVALRYYLNPSRTLEPIHLWKLMSTLLFGIVLFAVATVISDGETLEFAFHAGDAGIHSQGGQKRQ